MVDGRRRFLVGDAAKHTTMANNIVQGSCASAMKLALYGIHKSLPAIDETARLVAVIHDEVLIECKQGCGKAILAMAQAQMLNAGAEIFGPEVPLEAEGGIGSSWGQPNEPLRNGPGGLPGLRQQQHPRHQLQEGATGAPDCGAPAGLQRLRVSLLDRPAPGDGPGRNQVDKRRSH